MPFEFHLPSLEEMRATPDGIEMLRMIDDDNFRSGLISGCPGSGKTTVSIYRLVRLYSQNARVYLLTYQNMLVLAIRSLVNVQRVPSNRISTFHSWYRTVTHNHFYTDNPPTVEQMIECFQHTRIEQQGLEEILIDEGQDLPNCVYQVIPRYARRFFVGADNGQQVHPNHGTNTEQIEQSLRDNFALYRRFALGRNFRNTYETYLFARQFIPRTNLVAWDNTILERLLHSNRRGPKPLVIAYRDPNRRNEHLRVTLQNAEGNVAILCPLGQHPRNRKCSGESVDEVYQLVTQMGIPASMYHSQSGVPQEFQRYVVTTFKSAKGMEFDIVIIPRVNFFKRIPEEWYVACTRARRQLFVYRDLGNPQCDPIAHFSPDTYESISLETPLSDATDEILF